MKCQTCKYYHLYCKDAFNDIQLEKHAKNCNENSFRTSYNNNINNRNKSNNKYNNKFKAV